MPGSEYGRPSHTIDLAQHGAARTLLSEMRRRPYDDVVAVGRDPYGNELRGLIARGRSEVETAADISNGSSVMMVEFHGTVRPIDRIPGPFGGPSRTARRNQA